MKKISALLFLAITLPLTINAQDTVMFGDTTYRFIPHSRHVYFVNNEWGIPASYFCSNCSMESPKQIYGIAITGNTNGIFETLVVGMAYKNNDTTFDFFYGDSIQNTTIRKVTVGYFVEQDTIYVPCYELYFSKGPFILSDSMFVFYHQYRTRPETGFFPMIIRCMERHQEFYDSTYNDGCPWETYNKQQENSSYPTRFTRLGPQCFIYPILTPDRPYAIPVTGLRRTGQGPDNATFVWDDMQVREWYNTTDSSAYELRLQQGDSTLRTMATGDTTLRLDALTPGVLYSASVRQTLHHTCLHHADSTLYGPWSSPIYFRLTGTVDIDDPAADSHAPLRLYPNPAAAEATLEADAALLPANLVITDAQGRPCHTQPLTTPTCRIPLATLPAGHYTVTLHTPSRHPSRHPSIPLIIQH